MSEPTVAELYDAGVERHLTLAADLTEDHGATPTVACPGWTVRDVYAHLAGAAADILAGRVDGAGSDAWTGVQVAERAGRSLAEVVAEYAVVGPELVEALAAFPIERIAIDQWSHEQDIRGTIGRPGSRAEPVVAWSAALMADGLAAAFATRELPPVALRASTVERVLGEGEPRATFLTDDFELVRGVLGRRSPAQLRSWAEPGGDPEAVAAAVGSLAFFGPRTDDLVE